MRHNILQDEELIYLYRQGCEEAFGQLIDSYRRYGKMLSNHYLNYPWTKYIGFDDLLGVSDYCFYACLDSYRDDIDCTFKTFYSTCLRRRFKGLEGKVRNLKNKAMFEAVNYNYQSNNEKEKSRGIEEYVSELTYSYLPHRHLMIKETIEDVETIITRGASKLEHDIWRLSIEGYSLEEIASELNVDKRSISNARYRIKNKIKNYSS